jgi:hypothetical protein
MERNGFVSHVHRKRPKGRPIPEAIGRANNAKSKIRFEAAQPRSMVALIEASILRTRKDAEKAPGAPPVIRTRSQVNALRGGVAWQSAGF